MVINSLELFDFRNYRVEKYRFGSRVNLVLGDNGSGKSNLLEAVYLLSVGESFRARKIEEMINFEGSIARIKGRVSLIDGKTDLEMILTKGEVGGKKTPKRKFLVEEVAKRRRDFAGLFLAVLFRPEDLELMDGSPAVRRKFLDVSLLRTDPSYERSLSTYEQALRRRNKLLDAIREGVANRYALTFWDGLLIKHGQELERKRQEYVDYINRLWEKSDLFNNLKVIYDKSVISEARLKQYKDEEVLVGYTLVGPHKDDFVIITGEDKEVAVYGSRGEQRMAVLALKMGEIYFLELMKKVKPILLLDDIFSELDENHREEVLRVTKDRQVIVTTTEESEKEKFGKVKLIKLTK